MSGKDCPMRSIICVHHTFGALTISDEGVGWVGGAHPDQWSDEWTSPAERMPTFTREGGENIVIMDWTGEDTWRTASDGALAKFFSFTKGTAEFVFVAEDGNMVGVRVEDGKMSVHSLKLDFGKQLDIWKTKVEVGDG